MSWPYRRRKRRKPLTGRKRKCPVCKVPKYTADMVPVKKCLAEGFSDWMCKDCFAEEKRKFVYITPDLPVTPRVERKLRKHAARTTPTYLREWLLVLILFSILGVVGLGVLLMIWLPLPTEYLNAWFKILITIFVVVWWAEFFKAGMRWCMSPRDLRINEQIVELAKVRQQENEEAELFYASAEWKNIRARVIKEEGSHCYLCQQDIVDPNEVAVDHVKPRSLFPELALIRENLRVACHSCNSSKGARQTT